MNEYRRQIAALPPEKRSSLEQAYIVWYAMQVTPTRPVRCDPRPEESPSYFPFLVWALATSLLTLLLLALWWSRWRHPRRPRPPAAG